METNDTTEVLDTPIEETQEEVETHEQEEEIAAPTLEDYNKLQAKLKTMEIQRAKALSKLRESKANITNNKALNPQSLTSRDEIFLIADLAKRGYTKEDLDAAEKIATIYGKTLAEAANDEMVTSRVNARLAKERSEKASLGTSNSSFGIKTEKPLGEMTREEHESFYKKTLGLG